MSKIKVLIVEDEPLIAEDIKDLLSNYNYVVVGVAYTKDEALQYLGAQGVGTANDEMLTENFSEYVIPGKYVKYSDLDDVEIPITGREIFKDPITGDGTKKSAKGLLAVINGKLVDQTTWEMVNSDVNEMQTIFDDGSFVEETSLTEIRNTINNLIK